MACGKLTWQEADYYFFGKIATWKETNAKFCSSCPVRQQCLDEALALGDLEKGFLAGTRYSDRVKMLNLASLESKKVDQEPTGYQETAARLAAIFDSL